MQNNQVTTKQKQGCAIGCLGIIVLFIVAIVVLVLSLSKDEELSEAEQKEVNTIIANFESSTPDYITATNGVVKKIEMRDLENSDTFIVYVYIDESSWAKSNESEKASVAATINRQMNQLASPTEVSVYLISASNGDELARPNITGEGYKIVR